MVPIHWVSTGYSGWSSYCTQYETQRTPSVTFGIPNLGADLCPPPRNTTELVRLKLPPPPFTARPRPTLPPAGHRPPRLPGAGPRRAAGGLHGGGAEGVLPPEGAAAQRQEGGPHPPHRGRRFSEGCPRTPHWHVKYGHCLLHLGGPSQFVLKGAFEDKFPSRRGEGRARIWTPIHRRGPKLLTQ